MAREHLKHNLRIERTAGQEECRGCALIGSLLAAAVHPHVSCTLVFMVTILALATALFSSSASAGNSFPLIGLMAGSTAYAPVAAAAAKPLFAVDMPSLGGILTEGPKQVYELKLRSNIPAISGAANCATILRCKQAWAYEAQSDYAAFATQQNLILIFDRKLELDYKNAADHVEYSAGDESWQVRFLNDDENWHVYVQSFKKGKCIRTTEFLIDGGQIAGEIPKPKAQDAMCGSFEAFTR